jgi:hypothetical protein
MLVDGAQAARAAFWRFLVVEREILGAGLGRA